jgi:hypothetical protein
MPSMSVAGNEIRQCADHKVGRDVLTLLFKKHSTFGDNDRHIAVDEAFAILVLQGNCHVCISDAVGERNTKDARSDFSYSLSVEISPARTCLADWDTRCGPSRRL